MNAGAFIAKWRNATLKERSAAQEHFIDLCRLLEVETPAEADPKGKWYAFEYGAKKAGGGDGWADVWKRGCFGWEYKGKGKDLRAAFRQLQLYAPALQYPPLLVVSDLDSVVIHTAFTNAVQETRVVPIESLEDAEQRRTLKWVFTEPERLRPGRTRTEVTAEAAGRFADLAEVLRGRGHEPHAVAHFLNRLLFCLFAEDVDLLPGELFTRLLENARKRPADAGQLLRGLFVAMRDGGAFGIEAIPYFNGGLYNDEVTLPLEQEEIETLLSLARMDWQDVEPAIFGTLFERGLDPGKRSQLGAHYTDPATIHRLIGPTISEPLRAEWEEKKARVKWLLAKADKAKTRATATKHRKAADAVLHQHLERLRNFRVLDPACGSGNFLYLALQELKNLEHEANLEAESLGLHRSFPGVGPENLRGIELNPYAAELARVTIWIGEIQWMLNHGYDLNRDPVLKPLETIEERDALINPDGSEAEWPAADVIIGNPPFLGGKKQVGELGETYISSVRSLFRGRVPGLADFVTYWFEKARVEIVEGRASMAALVGTNSIRDGFGREVMKSVEQACTLFCAWPDEPWVNEGAALRVSLVCFASSRYSGPIALGGNGVARITASLEDAGELVGGLDLTKARRLDGNKKIAFQGTTRSGPFEIPGDMAREWISLPNPHARSNREVLRPWINGGAISGRSRDYWIIDYGVSMEKEEACLFEEPFRYVEERVKPTRIGNRNPRLVRRFWHYDGVRVGMRKAIQGLPRYVATIVTAKYRVFVWVESSVLADATLVAVARSDDASFGILNSRIHELWSLRMCSWLGKGNDPRYTPTTTFETFPFPEGLTPDLEPEEYTNPHAEAIAEAARRLNELRENWLNPPEWVDRVPEVVEGYPERIIPKPEHEKALKKRTLTNLYNQRPAWLEHAHRRLDEAVAAAYGWTADLPDEEILRRLLALNLERAAKQG